jgi:hypothetical protein
MDKHELLTILNKLAIQCAVLQCQSIAIQQVLARKKLMTPQEFDESMAAVFEKYTAPLRPEQSDAERLQELLRTFQGRPQ